MKLNMRVAALMPLAIMVRRIALFSQPVIIIGDDLRIIAKNRHAARLIPNLRRNGLIKRFLTGEDAERMSRMKLGQMQYVRLTVKDFELEASVICGNGYRLLVLTSFMADLHQSIGRIYNKTSGYDTGLELPGVFDDGKAEKEAHRLLSSIEQNDGFGERNAVFNGTNLIRRIASESISFGKAVNASVAAEGMGIYGSGYDFAAIIAYMIAFLDDNSSGEVISLSLGASGKTAVITVSCMTYLTDEEISSVVNWIDGNSPYSHWFRLLSLLAEGNLWRFSMESLRAGDITFRIEAPLVEKLEECVLRDIGSSDLHDILLFVFG